MLYCKILWCCSPGLTLEFWSAACKTNTMHFTVFCLFPFHIQGTFNCLCVQILSAGLISFNTVHLFWFILLVIATSCCCILTHLDNLSLLVIDRVVYFRGSWIQPVTIDRSWRRSWYREPMINHENLRLDIRGFGRTVVMCRHDGHIMKSARIAALLLGSLNNFPTAHF